MSGPWGEAGGIDVHGVTVGLGSSWAIRSEWALGFAAAAILGGDFRSFGDEGLSLSTLATATWAASEDLTVVLGAILVKQPDDFYPLPVLSVRWRPDPRWRLELAVPTYAEIAWLFDLRSSVALRATLSSVGGLVSGDGPFSLHGRATHLEIAVSARFEHRFHGPFAFFVDAGVVPYNEYQYRPLDGDVMTSHVGSASAVAQAGFAVALKR